MNTETRNQLIASFGEAHILLVEALANYPKEMWQFKPTPNSWSIHEIVVHIADSEANSYIRCRRAIAENGKNVIAYDQDKWAKSLNYHEQSIEDALTLFKYLRKMSFDLIKDLPESVWQNTIEHPENGTMTLEDWLLVYAAHIPGHIQQMQGVFEAWKTNTTV